jgi:hypothetical protein
VRRGYAIWSMAARRSLGNRRLAAALALSTLVAATLLAAGPIYARATADLGLTFAIRDRLHGAALMQVQVRDVAIASSEGRALQEAIARRVEERIGWFTGTRALTVFGPRFAIDGGPVAGGARPAMVVPWLLRSPEAGVRVVEGRLPGPRTGAEEGMFELALSPASAQAGGLRVGDRITLLESFDDCERELPRDDLPPSPPCAPRTRVRTSFPARVVGIVEPADPHHPIWGMDAGALFDPYQLAPDSDLLLPALIDERGFFEYLGGMLPEYRATFQWNFVADPARISRENVQRARDDVIALRQELRAVDGTVESPLEQALKSFGQELRYRQVPLLLLMLQIAGIVLFAVALTASVVVERQSEQLALLRSRGASLWHIAGIYLLDGVSTGIPIAAAAPWLAAAATALLGVTPALHRATGGRLLPARVSPESFVLAGLGVGLSLPLLVLPAVLTAGHTAVTIRRPLARPGMPILRRYYLDVGIAGLAAVLLWELHERGSVFKPSVTGGVSADPLLLLSPTLLTLGVAGLVLRFFPLLLRLVRILTDAVMGATVSLGLRQVERSPGQSMQLALLVMMAVAASTVAGSYAGTAERSFRDRVSFEAGVDLRASSRAETPIAAGEFEGELARVPGVVHATAVIRTPLTLASPGSNPREMVLLAVDPEMAGQLLWFRDDLADEPLPNLMARLRGPAPRGRPLPDGTAAVSVWVDPSRAREDLTLWVRIGDATGATRMLQLGQLRFTGWRQLRARLADYTGPPLVPPLTLASLVLTEPPLAAVAHLEPLDLDDITAEGPDGATVVEDFEGPLRWTARPSAAPMQGGAISDELRLTDYVHGGAAAGRIVFRPGASSRLRGIYPNQPMVPLPVVASPGFVTASGVNVGQTALIAAGDSVVPVVVRGIARLFPTVAANSPFLVANRDHLLAWAATFGDEVLRRPNEIWLQTAPDANRQATRRALLLSPQRFTNIVGRAEALERVNTNPLIAAGGSGILLVASAAVLVVVGAVLVVTVVASVQRRQVDFAVLRAMGVSRRQMFAMLVEEYGIAAAPGMAGGILLGVAAGRRMLSFLDVTEAGVRTVPPFVPQMNWPTVAGTIALVGLTFLFAITVSMIWIMRRPPGQSLRGTE